MTPEQIKALRESATNIIAHEKQLEGQRTKLYNELEKVNTNTRQAVMMAQEARLEGDEAKAANFDESASLLAEKAVGIDTQIAAIDVELIEARQASEEAKSIASDSAIQMTQMKAKGAELRADFERAKMAEAEVSASGSPSFDSVKDKISSRAAIAEAEAELAEIDSGASTAGATAMVEKAAMESKAAARLAEIRSQMGIGMADTEPAPVKDDAADGSDDSGSDEDES